MGVGAGFTPLTSRSSAKFWKFFGSGCREKPVPFHARTRRNTVPTRPDTRHDPCLEAINDRLVDLVQCGGLAFRTEVVAAETAQGVAPHVVGQARHGFDRDSIVFGEHTVDLGLKRLRRLTHAI